MAREIIMENKDPRNNKEPFMVMLRFDRSLLPQLTDAQKSAFCDLCLRKLTPDVFYAVDSSLKTISDLHKSIKMKYDFHVGLELRANGFALQLELPLEMLRQVCGPIDVLPLRPVWISYKCHRKNARVCCVSRRLSYRPEYSGNDGEDSGVEEIEDVTEPSVSFRPGHYLNNGKNIPRTEIKFGEGSCSGVQPAVIASNKAIKVEPGFVVNPKKRTRENIIETRGNCVDYYTSPRQTYDVSHVLTEAPHEAKKMKLTFQKTTSNPTLKSIETEDNRRWLPAASLSPDDIPIGSLLKFNNFVIPGITCEEILKVENNFEDFIIGKPVTTDGSLGSNIEAIMKRRMKNVNIFSDAQANSPTDQLTSI